MPIETTKTAPVAAGKQASRTSGPTNADTDRKGGASHRVWVAMILAIVALVGVATVTITAERGTGQEATSAAEISGPEVGSQEFRLSLAERGFIPHKAVDRELLLLQRAVARGDVPAATLEAPSSATASLFTPEELLLIEAVRSGQVPEAALEPALLEQLDEGERASLQQR
ncbi:MAG: hypothetical protein EA387_07900 [Nitriliruptor sp.]|nr:MAG: hypothetical protein EA387_07900 [Nitriliruptor sp.]